MHGVGVLTRCSRLFDTFDTTMDQADNLSWPVNLNMTDSYLLRLISFHPYIITNLGFTLCWFFQSNFPPGLRRQRNPLPLWVKWIRILCVASSALKTQTATPFATGNLIRSATWCHMTLKQQGQLTRTSLEVQSTILGQIMRVSAWIDSWDQS